jgi:hypothetical protein
MTLDNQTQEYYKNNAVKLYADYIGVQGGISKFFGYIFKPGDNVLDIGAASGRDLLKLLDLKINAVGIEPCNELRAIAISKNPKLVTRLLPAIPPGMNGEFEGIICSAVLMHLDSDDVNKMVSFIKENIIDHGNVLISVPLEREGIDENLRDKNGRLFILRPASDYIRLFTKRNFTLINEWQNEDGLNRVGNTWVNLLFKKNPEKEEAEAIYYDYH